MKRAILVSLLVAFCSQAQSIDDEKQLELLANPLLIELTNAGLPPRLAEKEVTRLIGGLKKCWASEYNEIESEEQEVAYLQLGGETIATYKSPCISAFLVAVNEIVPGRRRGD